MNLDVISDKVEFAFCDYLIKNRTPEMSANFNLYEFQRKAERKHPCAIIEGRDYTERLAGQGIYDVALQIEIEHHGDDDEGTLIAYRKFAGAIVAVLNDKQAVRTALNKPAAGLDSRKVRDFHLFDYFLRNGGGDVERLKFTKVVGLLVVCQGKDPF